MATPEQHDRCNPSIGSATAIYLVDDDPLVRRSLTRLLESTGYQVQAFARPDVFLRHFSSHPTAVVILDIWMEIMTGMELLAHIYAKSPQTRLIFITGHEDRTTKITINQTGAFAFLAKPVDSALLLGAVRSALEPSSAPLESGR